MVQMGSVWGSRRIMLRTLVFGGWKLDLGLNKSEPEVGEIVVLICWLYRIQ